MQIYPEIMHILKMNVCLYFDSHEIVHIFKNVCMFIF